MLGSFSTILNFDLYIHSILNYLLPWLQRSLLFLQDPSASEALNSILAPPLFWSESTFQQTSLGLIVDPRIHLKQVRKISNYLVSSALPSISFSLTGMSRYLVMRYLASTLDISSNVGFSYHRSESRGDV